MSILDDIRVLMEDIETLRRTGGDYVQYHGNDEYVIADDADSWFRSLLRVDDRAGQILQQLHPEHGDIEPATAWDRFVRDGGYRNGPSGYLLALTDLRAFYSAHDDESAEDRDTVPQENPNDARDAFIYAELLGGTKLEQICRALRERVNGGERWSLIATPSGIKSAAKRYAKRRNLPRPPKRTPGRPREN